MADPQNKKNYLNLGCITYKQVPDMQNWENKTDNTKVISVLKI